MNASSLTDKVREAARDHNTADALFPENRAARHTRQHLHGCLIIDSRSDHAQRCDRLAEILSELTWLRKLQQWLDTFIPGHTER
jgi:hypothetical protein